MNLSYISSYPLSLSPFSVRFFLFCSFPSSYTKAIAPLFSSTYLILKLCGRPKKIKMTYCAQNSSGKFGGVAKWCVSKYEELSLPSS